MNNILRKLCAWICVPIYTLIPSIYKIFYNIASARFFNPEKTTVIQDFSQNLYVLISVVMLFGFSITLLSAIVNPDLISDNKKGVPAMFKRAFIGLALIIIIPFGFDEMYKIQQNVMSNSLIEKIIVGADFSCDEKKDPDCEPGQGGGQVIAGILINSVLHPAEDTVIIGADLQQSYSDMVQTDISNISSIASDINVKRVDGGTTVEDGDYGFHFDSLIAIIAGIGIDYILLIFAIDMAVRMFKLAFLELTAPISVVSYIVAGDKILMSWLKEVGKTFVDVFVKIASIALYLFLISNLNTFFIQFQDKSWSFILKAFLIVGMLIFAKQIPNMISSIFGIEMKSQGGISGRLGQMAMVGDQAKKAWKTMRNPLAVGAAIGSGIGGFAAHAGVGGVRSVQRGKAVAKQIRAEKGKAAGIRGFLAGAGGMVGAALTTPGALVRGVKSGATNKNLSAIGNEVERYDNAHPEGSTFLGRTKEKAKSFIGAPSGAAAQLARLDKEKVKIDAEIDFNNSIQQISKSIKDAIKNSIEKSDSNIKIGLVTTDKNGKMIAYNGNYNQIRERINAEKTAAANLTGQARTDEFARLSKVETELNNSRKKLTDSYLNDVLDNTSANHKNAMDDLGVGTTNTILQQKSEFEARTGTIMKDAKTLSKANDEAGKALYEGTDSLYSQQAKNQKERRERDSAGNLTEYGKMVQNDNAIKAKNNGNNSGKK